MQLIGLNTIFLGRKSVFFTEIDSTQDEIWRMYNYELDNGTLVIADTQTKAKRNSWKSMVYR